MIKQFVVALGVIAGLSLGSSLCRAQSAVLDLPRDSQHSVVTQRIGITDITINYHRPLVKGRTIWGKVVPYDKVWRAGANENTTITFTDPCLDRRAGPGERRLRPSHDPGRESVDDHFLKGTPPGAALPIRKLTTR